MRRVDPAIDTEELTIYFKDGKICKIAASDYLVYDYLTDFVDKDEYTVASINTDSIRAILCDPKTATWMLDNPGSEELSRYLLKHWSYEIGDESATEVAVRLLEKLKILERNSDELAQYLLKHWPHEMGNTDDPHGESAVEMAIRLLERMRATVEDLRKEE